MRAVAIRAHGGPSVLEVMELDAPRPRANEVGVKVAACGLNHLDLWVRGGLPNLKLPLPHVLGGDVAGVVDEVGADVTGLEPGTRCVLSPGVSCDVCPACLRGEHNLCRHYGILGEHRWGGNAERIVVPASNVVPLPDAVSFEDAACLPVTFVTAWQMVTRKARVAPGDVVLVQGAASGVGVALVQVARLFGATVIGTASTAQKRARLLEIGCAHALDSTRDELVGEIRALTDRRGVDAVFEHVGVATWERSVRCLRYGGRLVTCGATTGHAASIDLRVLFWKQIELMGSTMGTKGDFIAAVEHVAAGRMRPVRDCVMPLRDARAAHERVMERKHIGKVVLVPDW